MKTLRVISVSEEKTGKRNKVYKTIKLEQPNVHQMLDPLGSGNMIFVKGKPKIATINPGKNSFLEQDAEGNPIGPSEYGWDFKEGEFIQGSAVTRLVKPYPIGDRMVNTDTVAVFADSSNPEEFEIEVQRAFRARGRDLINSAPIGVAVTTAEEEETFE
jgi:hypothetical protein